MSLPSSPIKRPDDRLDPGSAFFGEETPLLLPVRKQLPPRVLGVLTVLRLVVLSLATWSALSH